MFKPLFKMSPRAFMAFNFISFQSAWLIAVKMQEQGLLLLIAILVGHFLVSQEKARDFVSLILISIIGCIVDASMGGLGLFVFKDNQHLPFWLMLLWANFSLTFHYSMAWLMKLPIFLRALLGGIFGCFSYYAAHKLGAVDYPFGTTNTIFILIIIWAISLPVYVSLTVFIRGKFDEHKTSELHFKENT